MHESIAVSRVFHRQQVVSILLTSVASLLGATLPAEQIRGTTDPDFAAIEEATRAAKPVAYWPLRERKDKSTPDVISGEFPAEFDAGAGPYAPDGRRSNLFGGRVLAKLTEFPDNYAVSAWFWNDLANDNRDHCVSGFARRTRRS